MSETDILYRAMMECFPPCENTEIAKQKGEETAEMIIEAMRKGCEKRCYE